ncbi:MAG TPA: choice-of-anchor D domain-containing protein [Mycobacterium sp.]|nr:choice-of-anchor D domain-containing protein [Mycobacterium sp.]
MSFIPQARTLVNGTITASDGTGNAKDTATVQGTGTGPLVITPSPVDFKDVAKGAVGLVTLTVTNKGATPMKAFVLTITGTNADEFFVQQDGLSGLSQLPGVGSAPANAGTVVLGFNPKTTAAASATFKVTTAVYDASGTNPVGNESGEVALIGNGVVGASITATTSDTFPSTFAGARSATAITVTVQNAANAQTTGQLKIGLLACGGAANCATSDFDLTYDSAHTAGTCWNVSSTSGLPAGGTCTILVWFKPRVGLSIAARSDTLQVLASPGGVATLALNGTALAQLEITASDSQHQGTAASPYDFGTVVINASSSKTLTFTVTNHGDTDVARGAVNISFHNSANWPVAPTSLFSVDSTGTTGCQGNTTTNIAIAKNGGTCTFTATAAGATATAGLWFKQLRVDAGGAQVALAETTVTAVDEAVLKLTDATKYGTRDIGTVLLNSTSNPVKYTVVNIGGANVTGLTGGLYVTATNTKVPATSPYAVATDTQSSCLHLTESGLAPGAHCDFVVTYQPTGAHADPTEGMVDLVITADNGLGTSPAVPIRQTIAATRTAGTTTAVEYLGDANNKAAADMGAMTAGVFSTQVVFYNGKNTDVTLASLGAVTVDSPTGSTHIGSATVTPGATGTCTTTGAVHANGGSCTLTVKYDTSGATALTPGWHQLTLTTDTATLRLFAYVPAGALLNPEPASFALGTPTSTQSAGQTVQIVNIGDEAVSVTAATPFPVANLVVSGCSGQTVQPLGVCTLTVAAKPTAGAASPTSPGPTVTLKHSSTPLAVVALSWGATTDPAISTADTDTDFGKQAVLSTSSNVTAFTFTNGDSTSRLTGPLSVTITSSAACPVASGATPVADFIITGGSCVDSVAATLGIDGGDNCKVNVQFTPVTLATPAKAAYLCVSSELGGGAGFKLTGTAVPALSAKNSAVVTTAADGTQTATFADTVITTGTNDQTITFVNEVNAPMTGFLTVTLSDPTQYHIVTDGCTGKQLVKSGSPAVAGSCDVLVRFAPTAVGQQKATITVSGTPGDSAVVGLVGTGKSS